MLGLKRVEFEGLGNIQMSSGNLGNLGLGQGKSIWQTHTELRVEAMEQNIGQKQERARRKLF